MDCQLPPPLAVAPLAFQLPPQPLPCASSFSSSLVLQSPPLLPLGPLLLRRRRQQPFPSLSFWVWTAQVALPLPAPLPRSSSSWRWWGAWSHPTGHTLSRHSSH